MKKYYLSFAMLTILLSGCSQDNQTLSKVSTPQTVENFTFSNTNTSTDVNGSTPTKDTTTSSQETQEEKEETTIKTFATQQDFVDYMYQKVVALEDTVALLDSNLSQLFAVSNTEETTGYKTIRENLFAQAANELNTMGLLTLPNSEVETLHSYVQKAYQYTIKAKQAEYEIYNSETLDARQQLLEANSENERLSTQYIQLSWDEIDRLSTTTIYRK